MLIKDVKERGKRRKAFDRKDEGDKGCTMIVRR